MEGPCREQGISSETDLQKSGRTYRDDPVLVHIPLPLIIFSCFTYLKLSINGLLIIEMS
jgi:hypothetical protein